MGSGGEDTPVDRRKVTPEQLSQTWGLSDRIILQPPAENVPPDDGENIPVDRRKVTSEQIRRHFDQLDQIAEFLPAESAPSVDEVEAAQPEPGPAQAAQATATPGDTAEPETAPEPSVTASPRPVYPENYNNGVMFLGYVKNSRRSLVEMVEKRREQLNDISSKYFSNVMPKDEQARYDLMPLNEYIYTVEKFDSLKRRLEKEKPFNGFRDLSMDLKPAQYHFLQQRVPFEFTPDYDGWVNYLRSRFPAAVQNDFEAAYLPANFPEASRRKHTLIVGPSDWGKSELIKALLFHYAQVRTAAVVVLDPGGDLVKQVSRWPELLRDNRLCLIQPGLEEHSNDGTGIGKGLTVGINPLDGTGLDANGRREAAHDWANTLSMIGSNQQVLSQNMNFIIVMCVQVLLSIPGATLEDLAHLLRVRPPRPRGEKERPEASPPRAAELQKMARNYEIARVADFFRHEYDIDSTESTREALLRRIEAVLNYPHAEAMLTGQPTINLAAEIEARRFILVDLSRFKKVGGAAIGRLLVAQITGIGRRREAQRLEDRTPTHLFIDEASTMVSASMFEVLKEMRKFKIYLTLGQQVGGDEMNSEQKAVLKADAGCKLIAPASAAKEWFSKENADDLSPLSPSEFLFEWTAPRGHAPIDVQKVRIRSNLVDYSHAVSDDEWQAYLRRITGRGGYYRSAALTRTVPIQTEPQPVRVEVEEASPAPAPTRPAPQKKAATPRTPKPKVTAAPPGVPPELADRYTSETGRKGDF